MGYLDRISECNRHDLRRYRAVEAGGRQVGWLREDRWPALRDASDRFRRADGRVVLEDIDEGRDDVVAARTALIAAAVELLHRAREIRAPLGELYPAASRLFGEPQFLIDRAAVAWFGIRACGVHLNGFVRRPDGIHMWIGERAGDKATFPGMLDNLVAGGQPWGIPVRQNLVKECAEEAGIPPEVAQRAVSVGAVSYCAEHDVGLKPDTMFCFDLELEEGFEPRNVDGEMAAFHLLPLAEVASIVRDTRRFKFNCNLVIVDFLVRHGFLDPESPDYPAVVAGLRRPLTPR